MTLTGVFILLRTAQSQCGGMQAYAATSQDCTVCLTMFQIIPALPYYIKYTYTMYTYFQSNKSNHASSFCTKTVSRITL